MPDDSWITIEYLGMLKQESENHISRTNYLTRARRGWQWYKKRAGLAPIEEFDDEEVPAHHATSRDNVIKEAVDEYLSIALKNDPIVRRYPHYPGDADLVDDIDKASLAAWRQARIRQVLATMQKEALIAGLSVGKVYWDIHRKRIAMEKINPDSLFIDPFANNDLRLTDVRYIIQKTRQRIDVVLRRYGVEAEIALGLRDAKGRTPKQKSKFSQVLARFANMPKEVLNRMVTGGGQNNSEEIADAFLDVYEFWIFPVVPNDVRLVSGDTKLDDAGYPYGVVVTTIEDRIVKTRANPYVKNATRITMDDRGLPKSERIKIGPMRHPYCPLFWDRVSDDDGNNRIYDCMGMVEQMIPMQFQLDAIRRNVSVHVRTTANPWGLIDQDMLDIPAEEITQRPGELIPAKNLGIRGISDAIYINNGAQMPNEVFAWMDRMAPEMKQRVGLRAGVTGGFPQPGTSHTPAMTIGALQEAAFTPLYEHINELSETIKDISVLMDGLMQMFYTVGDYMNVSEQGAQRFVQWSQRHVVANFRREVVAAATTSMFDMDKHNRLAEIAAVTNEALLQQNPQLIQSTIYLLVNMDYPWAFDWVQLLQQELQRLQQQQQELQQLGALGLMQGQGAIPEGQPQALPPGEDGIDDDELAGLEELEGLTGVSAEELMMALEQE